MSRHLLFKRFPCVILPFFLTWFFPQSWIDTPAYKDAAQKVVSLVNLVRALANLQPLQASRTLSLIACGHAMEMAASEKVTHLSSGLELTPRDRIGYTFPCFRFYGENVARAGSPEKLHENLMASASHRDNILNENFSVIGVGLVTDRSGTFYLVQDFIGSTPEETKPSLRSPYFMASPEKVVAVVGLLVSGEEPPIAEVSSKIGKFTIGPDANEGLVKEGIVRAEEGKYAEAIRCFRKVLETDPGHRDARYNLALTLQKKGEFSESLKIFESLYERDPNDLEALYSIGRYYYIIGDFEKAEEKFRTVIARMPDIHDAPLILVYCHYTLGSLSERRGRKEEAGRHYRRVIEIAEQTGLEHPLIEKAREKMGRK